MFPTAPKSVLLYYVLYLLFDHVVACNLRCASFGRSVINSSLTIKDGSVLGNIPEEFAAADQSFNVSGQWAVTPNCQLNACTGPYFGGNCEIFSADFDIASSPVGIWQSVKCSCKRACDCSSIHLKKSVCARAYQDSLGKGCSVCSSLYTEMEPGENLYYPEEFKGKTTSILVRKGCQLNLYAEEELDGDSEIIQEPVHEARNFSIGSYTCDCNDDEYVPAITDAQDAPSDAINIPGDMDGIAIELSRHNYSHLGLSAALASLQHKRSSQNVYVLVIGSTGAGKSTTINSLLDSPNFSKAGKLQSTTLNILEFQIPLPRPELGIANSELRIIDTPGLGDTSGSINDATFLATLDDYFSGHEELSKRIPNLVLVFHRFDDNRFAGENAQFVKMIRAMGSFREKITDENFSNVIFVFSHFCSASKELQKDPSSRLKEYREVIEKYSLFPKPIMTAAIENKGAGFHLSMRDNNFELPNGEYFPKNLVEKLEHVTEKSGDELGNFIVTAAFSERRLGENFNASVKKIEGVNPQTHAKVPKYMKALFAASLSISDTEVSKLLKGIYKKMSSRLKAKHPSCLQDLQRYLHLRNIHSLSDVPRTARDILQLLRELDNNDAIAYLLERALNLKPPSFPENIFIGKGYNMLRRRVLNNSPFKYNSNTLKWTPIGFGLPQIFNCSKVLRSQKWLPIDIRAKSFATMQDYYKQEWLPQLLPTDLVNVVNSTALFNSIARKPETGIFLKDVSCLCPFTIPVTYKSSNIKVSEKNQRIINPQFLRTVKGLPTLNRSDYENVEKWATFFEDYGTHVISSVDLGGSIDFKVSVDSSTSLTDTAVDAVRKFVDYLEDTWNAMHWYQQAPSKIFSELENITTAITFHGGNRDYYFERISSMSLEETSSLLANWKHSLDYNPAVVKVEYVTIAKLVKMYVSSQEEKVLEAFKALLEGSLEYELPPNLSQKDSVELKLKIENAKELRIRINKLEEDVEGVHGVIADSARRLIELLKREVELIEKDIQIILKSLEKEDLEEECRKFFWKFLELPYFAPYRNLNLEVYIPYCVGACGPSYSICRQFGFGKGLVPP